MKKEQTLNDTSIQLAKAVNIFYLNLSAIKDEKYKRKLTTLYLNRILNQQ